MKKITYLLVLLVAGSVAAQEDCNLQYDGNGDGAVNIEDVLGILSEFGEACEPVIEYGAGCGSDTTLSYHGYTYSLTEVNNQCWFAENLRTEFFANGDSIMPGYVEGQWIEGPVGAAYAVYGDGTSTVVTGNQDAFENLELHGRLYNHNATIDNRGLCPNGWRVPNDDDWDELLLQINLAGYLPNDLVSSSDDSTVFNFGFHLGGYKINYGTYYDSEGSSEWQWSTDKDNEWLAHSIHWNNGPGVGWVNSMVITMGFSVRCIKD